MPEPMEPKPTTLYHRSPRPDHLECSGFRWQGWQDSPLTDLGIAQANEAAAELRDRAIDHAFTSDAGRAIQTAAIVAASHGSTALPVYELRERNYGGYEGLTSVEIEERFPGSRFTPSCDNRETWRPPDGETLIEVRERVFAFANAVVRDLPGYAHGHPQRGRACLRQHLFGKTT